tara:strand:+ start:13508 stop:14206 length:699 start_codon:yes stop_codon:yes gene_type:complete
VTSSVISHAFEIKGMMQTILILHLKQVASDSPRQLSEHFAQAPKLFKNQPMIFNISEINTNISADFIIQVYKACQSHKINVIGVSGCHSLVAQEAVKAAQLKEITTRPTASEKSAEKQEPLSVGSCDVIRSTHVRSGQQIESKGNLTIIGNVSRGAEIVANGSIYIFGNLLGRAIAGASGDKKSKIVAQAFDPELICIAGIYTTSEQTECYCPSTAVAELDDETISLRGISS